MAGQEIYLGKMLESMEAKLSTIDTMIAELQNINTTVSQGVSELNIKVGTTNVASLNNAAKSGTLSTSSYTSIGSLSSAAKGSAKLEISTSAGNNGNVNLGYSLNGGTTWLPLTTVNLPVTTSMAVRSIDVAIEKGTYLIGLKSVGAANEYSVAANSMKLKYDIVDIVNEGAFTIV